MKTPALIIRALLLLLMLYQTDAKMEMIITNPNIPLGGQILLLCKAGGEGDITWLKDGEETEAEVTKIDETSSKLLINSVTMQDAGKYACQCEFENGHKDEVVIELYVYEGPSFGNTATYHEFLQGADGVVPCLVTGQPAVDVVWLRDMQKIMTAEGTRVRQLPDNTLFIKNVKREDAGLYVCQAQIRGRPVNKQLNVSVVVNVPPTVNLKEEEKKVLAGTQTNVSLVCLVDGLPAPNITWTMPTAFDPSHHHYNSDRSQLVITSVARADLGEYVCTATNKIAESSATIMLHVYEAPEVFVSDEQLSVSVGERVSVFCNVSGHPQPELHWLNKHNGRTLVTASGRIHVVEGELVIEDVMPSDGGLYSCMAVSTSGNASRDVAIHTQPDKPHYMTVSPGPRSVLFSLKVLPISGGTPITSFVMQWRQNASEQWKNATVPVAGPLVITSLKQYTSYTVRLAALNAVGMGQFSETFTVHTQGIHGEPDTPVLSLNQLKVDKNTFSIPLRQSDAGGIPIEHFNIRYKKDKKGAEWKEMQLSPDAASISLQDLSFGSGYHMEVTAVNANGSSIPSTFSFTTGEPASSMTKGGIVGIVIVIFLVVFLAVDATCCYRNHCGLLMSIGVKLFGQKVPGLKMLGNAEENTNGEVKLKGLSTPRGSMQMGGVQTKESGQLTEVTCDKAALTKHEKIQPINP